MLRLARLSTRRPFVSFAVWLALAAALAAIDPISIIGIFAFIFGVSMVYEVGFLHRTREAFLETGDAHGAVWTGLRETAAAATGAAAVMLAAIIPFAMVDLLSVQVFGVGVAIAILLDALIVRPVLLPGAASLLGRWSWWPLSRQAPPTPPATRRRTTESIRWVPRWRHSA